MEHCSVLDLTCSGPHRPGDPLGPTSGGSIGSQGMGDPVYLFTSCSAVPAIQGHMAECYGHCSVLGLTSSGLLRSWHTWIPYGTYFRRVHRIPGLAGYLIRPAVHSDMAVCYGALYCIPLDLSGWHRPGDRLGPTSGGSIGSQGPGMSCTSSRPASPAACSTLP